jgi:large subunit ribosomal protein L3
MAGHMGQDNVTTLNLTVFRVDVERGLILIKGAVPGTEGTYVKIRDAVKKAAPEGLPKPGAFRKLGEEAASPAVVEAPAADAPEAGSEA